MLEVIDTALLVPPAVYDINDLTEPVNREANEDEEANDHVHREQVKSARGCAPCSLESPRETFACSPIGPYREDQETQIHRCEPEV